MQSTKFNPNDPHFEEYIYERQNDAWVAVNSKILIWDWVFRYYGFVPPCPGCNQAHYENDLCKIFFRIYGHRMLIDVELKDGERPVNFNPNTQAA